RRGRDRLAEMAMVLAALFPLAGGAPPLGGARTSREGAPRSAIQGVTRLSPPGAAKTGFGLLPFVGGLPAPTALGTAPPNPANAPRLAAPTHSVVPEDPATSPPPTPYSPPPAPTSTSPAPVTTPPTASPTTSTTSPSPSTSPSDGSP